MKKCCLQRIDLIKVRKRLQVYHLIQSFAEVEITPEVAYELGLEYVKEVFGKDFEVVVLLTENKIGSLDDLNTFRTKLEDEVRTLKGARENLLRTMPEDLPTPNKSLKQLEKENNKKLKKTNQ